MHLKKYICTVIILEQIMHRILTEKIETYNIYQK